MPDPNADYKSTFARLTAELGRPPTTRDNGWLAMHEEYKRGWAPGSETTAPQARRSPGSDAAGRPVPTEDAREVGGVVDARIGSGVGGDARESAGGADQPLSGSGINAEGEGGASEPGASVGPSPVLQGGRGPNGGVLAVCQACGQEWEREKRRGRPALVCPSCR